jgi:hypothetical protein
MPLYGKLMGTLFAGYNLSDSFGIDYLSDTLKVSLHTVSYAYNQDTHQFWSDTTNEITGTGYTARGQALANKAISYNSSTNTTTLSADNPSWTSSTITAQVAVLYKDTGTNSTSPLLAYFDFGSSQISSAGTFTIVWNASGIATFTVA